MTKRRTYKADRTGGTGGFYGTPFAFSEETESELRDLLKKFPDEKINGFLKQVEKLCELSITKRRSAEEDPENDRILAEIEDAKKLSSELSDHIQNWHRRSESFVGQRYRKNRKSQRADEFHKSLISDLDKLADACERVLPSIKAPAGHPGSGVGAFFGIELAKPFKQFLSPNYKISAAPSSLFVRLLQVLSPVIGSEANSQAVARVVVKHLEK